MAAARRGAVGSAWWNAFQAFAKLPTLIGSSFVLFLLVQLALFTISARLGFPYLETMRNPHPSPQASDTIVWLGLAASIPDAGIRAALAVSVHRYVLMAEENDRIAVPQTRRDARFAYWLLLTTLILQAPSLLRFMAGGSHPVAAQLAAIPIMLVVFMVVLRLTLLFPAVALDQPDALWRGWRLSRSHAWRILWTSFLVILPLAAMQIISLFLVFRGGNSTAVVALISAFDSTLGVGVLAAMASVFYRLYSAEATWPNTPSSLV